MIPKKKEEEHPALKPPPLLPCPFCGGEAVIRADGDGWNQPSPLYVSCAQCGCRTAGSYCSWLFEYRTNLFTTTSRLLAVRAWNSRPGEGTSMCPQCGVGVPHTHQERENIGGSRFSKQTFIVLLEATR